MSHRSHTSAGLLAVRASPFVHHKSAEWVSGRLELYLYDPVMVKIDIMWRIIEVRALLLIVEGHPGPYMPIPYIRSIMGTIIMILVLIILYIGWGFWIQFW